MARGLYFIPPDKQPCAKDCSCFACMVSDRIKSRLAYHLLSEREQTEYLLLRQKQAQDTRA